MASRTTALWNHPNRRDVISAAYALLGITVTCATAHTKQGRTFYVSPQGDDNNPGSFTAPFATFARAFSSSLELGAHDTIRVLPGTYNEQLIVTAGGDGTGDLTIRSEVPGAALIRSPRDTYSAVDIQQSFVTLDGFDVQAGGDGHGIEATFLEGNNRNEGPHHISIVNNLCHDSAGSGISLSYGDYYRIEGNICFGNCATNTYQGSGISIYAARAVDGPQQAFRNLVRNNVCYENMATSLPGNPPHSDGNGIIVDDLLNSQSRHKAGSYPFRTLVENNVAYRNGGRGVHIFLSENVLVRNNTCCYNNRDPKNPATWRGELSNVDSNKCVWVNNLGVADPTINPANTGIMEGWTRPTEKRDVVWKNNLTFGGSPGSKSAKFAPSKAVLENLFGVDPLFVRGMVGVDDPDYRLRQGSPGIDAGTLEYGIATVDLDGNPRPSNRYPDIGAFERV